MLDYLVGAEVRFITPADYRERDTLLARVVSGNAVSLKLHENAGFALIGVMREVGRKFGQRLDVQLLQLML